MIRKVVSFAMAFRKSLQPISRVVVVSPIERQVKLAAEDALADHAELMRVAAARAKARAAGLR